MPTVINCALEEAVEIIKAQALGCLRKCVAAAKVVRCVPLHPLFPEHIVCSMLPGGCALPGFGLASEP